MERRFRVFISHSAHADEEPGTLQSLNLLCEQLEAISNVEVLVDQRSLAAGDEWCQRLYAWMGLCDAAVILLSPRAITRAQSTWVPREVNLLMWRKSLDPEFLIIPTLVSGLQRDQIADNPFIADLNVSGLQFADGLTDEQKIDTIRSVIAQRAQAATRNTVFDSLHVFVQDSLHRFAPRAALEATLSRHYGDDPWHPFSRSEDLLAAELLRHAVEPDVDKAIGDVARGSQPEYHLAIRLFQALFPMRLPAEQSCTLLTLCREQVGRGAVVVNCHDAWFVRMMLRAATGQLEDDLLRSWRIIELPNAWGDDDESEISEYLANELAEAVLGTGGWELLLEEPDPIHALREHLQEFSRDSGAPILVCAAYTQRWTELAPTLAARFPTIVFLLWSGAEMPGITDTDETDALPLRPALPAGEDRRWILGYRRKIQLLGTQP